MIALPRYNRNISEVAGWDRPEHGAEALGRDAANRETRMSAFQGRDTFGTARGPQVATPPV
ncbi:hypothetical protein [Saccharothrix sp. NRRL B-16314]|uniref:hypothetical protein n=1 Tax=Saccharothrix sp. NRRL B-16314 TaxID=1463825 RepID=UPI00052702B0|nr:hypothetical protein [Saccharothrix sp. NRRL B-16314]